MRVEDAAAREFISQLLTAQGMVVTDEVIEQTLPELLTALGGEATSEAGQAFDRTARLIVEDGLWVICDDEFGFADGGSAAPASPAPASPASGVGTCRVREAVTRRLGASADGQPARKGVSSWPRPSTSTITRSPPLSQTCSFMPAMTPAGVPVIITSPGSSVKYVLQ